MIPLRDRLSTRIFPIVNYVLIAINLFAFLWELANVEAGYADFVNDWGLIPARLIQNPAADFVTVATSMFLHGGWMHIIGNMLFLWIFGDNVEDALGHVRYAIFYLCSGLIAASAQIIVDPSSTVPMVGASGAIAGVLGAYVSLYPRAKVLVLVPILFFASLFEFPAWLVIAEWFLLQLISGVGALAGARSGGIAFFAHIGGFVAGLVLIRLFMHNRTALAYDPWSGWRTAPVRRGSPPHLPNQRRYDHWQD